MYFKKRGDNPIKDRKQILPSNREKEKFSIICSSKTSGKNAEMYNNEYLPLSIRNFNRR
jgi:hypothetical protein